jgi:hypothetical protein
VHSGRFANVPGGNIGLRHIPGGGIIGAIAARRGGAVQPTQAADDGFVAMDDGYGTPAMGRLARGRERIAGRGVSGTPRTDPLADGLVGGVKKLLQSVSRLFHRILANLESVTLQG